ncbi:hypothetical protein BDZ89DRAFT_974653, partial [Hymenopellis radicata]
STLTQLRTSHIGLNAHLYRTRTIDSPLCRSCGVPETVTHFIMSCRRYSSARNALRNAVRSNLRSLKQLLAVGSPHIAATLKFVRATKRLLH